MHASSMEAPPISGQVVALEGWASVSNANADWRTAYQGSTSMIRAALLGHDRQHQTATFAGHKQEHGSAGSIDSSTHITASLPALVGRVVREVGHMAGVQTCIALNLQHVDMQQARMCSAQSSRQAQLNTRPAAGMHSAQFVAHRQQRPRSCNQPDRTSKPSTRYLNWCSYWCAQRGIVSYTAAFKAATHPFSNQVICPIFVPPCRRLKH
eukprot:scaffold121139_cov20-Tisochrysis_lutea.AAC.2